MFGAVGSVAGDQFRVLGFVGGFVSGAGFKVGFKVEVADLGLKKDCGPNVTFEEEGAVKVVLRRAEISAFIEALAYGLA